MAIKKTPRALILVLDSEGKVTGHELEYFATWESEGKDDPMVGLFQSQVKREELTPEQFAEMQDDSDALLAAEAKSLHGKIAELQEQVKEAEENLRVSEKARLALGAVIEGFKEKITEAKAALE